MAASESISAQKQRSAPWLQTSSAAEPSAESSAEPSAKFSTRSPTRSPIGSSVKPSAESSGATRTRPSGRGRTSEDYDSRAGVNTAREDEKSDEDGMCTEYEDVLRDYLALKRAYEGTLDMPDPYGMSPEQIRTLLEIYRKSARVSRESGTLRLKMFAIFVAIEVLGRRFNVPMDNFTSKQVSAMSRYEDILMMIARDTVESRDQESEDGEGVDPYSVLSKTLGWSVASTVALNVLSKFVDPASAEKMSEAVDKISRPAPGDIAGERSHEDPIPDIDPFGIIGKIAASAVPNVITAVSKSPLMGSIMPFIASAMPLGGAKKSRRRPMGKYD